MKRLVLAFVVVAAAALTGCQRTKRGFSVQELVAKIRGPDERRLVAQMFESDDPDLRRSAVERLSREKKCRREPYLKGYAVAAADPDPTVRSAAVRALGLGGDAKYLDNLIAALNDRDATVRWDAAVALDSVTGDKAVRPLAQAALNDGSVDVRSAAAWALRHYKRGDVVETLLQCLADADFSVRFKASESLTELTGRQGGTDPAGWREALADRDDMFAPRRAAARPWWDFAGLTRREPAPEGRAAEAAEPPEPAPAGQDEPKRPWWDWLRVTKPKASGRASGGAPAGA